MKVFGTFKLRFSEMVKSFCIFICLLNYYLGKLLYNTTITGVKLSYTCIYKIYILYIQYIYHEINVANQSQSQRLAPVYGIVRWLKNRLFLYFYFMLLVFVLTLNCSSTIKAYEFFLEPPKPEKPMMAAISSGNPLANSSLFSSAFRLRSFLFSLRCSL